MDLSDSESEDDEMMQNGDGDEEDEDLSQFTVDTFESRPMGGETAINTVSCREVIFVSSELISSYGQCIPKWRNHSIGSTRL